MKSLIKGLPQRYAFVTALVIGLFMTGCNVFDNKMQGFVGEDPRNPEWGTTTNSSLVALSPFVPQIKFIEGGVVEVNIQFNQSLPVNSSLQWSIDGGGIDFVAASGTVNVPQGATTAQFVVSAKVDGIYEGSENYNLVVQGPSDVFLGSITIPSEIQEMGTQPVVSFSGFGGTVQENGVPVEFNATLSQPVSFPIQVSIQTTGTASTGTDFTTSVPGSIIFEPGEVSKTLAVSLIDDTQSEVVEDVVFRLKSVTQGNASIDTANDRYTVLIQDNDASNLFSITGVRGGVGSTDTVNDQFLTEGSVPTVVWTNALDNFGYEATIFEENGTTVKCQKITTATDVVSLSFTGCNLTEGARYKVSVVALTATGPVAANNTMFAFTRDTLLPTNFGIFGVMGGFDVAPDTFLAGSTQPTVVWEDAVGESGYEVFVLNAAETVVLCSRSGASTLPAGSLPANVTSYFFEGCVLSPGVTYKIRVFALDITGVKKAAQNNSMNFLVTSNASGYLITGVTGGTDDILEDGFMDDGAVPVINWQLVSYANKYDVVVRNSLNAVICSAFNLSGSTKTISFDQTDQPSCLLKLHEDYTAQVTAYNASGVAFTAANGPFSFRHRVGLYISGSAASQSYYKGQAITSCGGVGGSVCNATTPYVVGSKIDEIQVRLDNGGVIAGTPWVSGAPVVGNGVLEMNVKYLRIGGASRISMDGRGYKAGQGPGGGVGGSDGGGGSHAGYAGGTTSAPAGVVYGAFVDTPDQMGSGGADGYSGVVPGGRGGGIINLDVYGELYSTGGAISANGAGGTAHPNPLVKTGSGGGAGGSVYVRNLAQLTGTGLTFEANGGAGGPSDAGAGAGSGGRVAVHYTDISGYMSGLITNFVASLKVHGESAGAKGFTSAAGTAFYKGPADALGHLVSENNNLAYRETVETPLPQKLFDSVKTLNNATFVIPSTDQFILPPTLGSNILDFRVVIAGELQLTGNPAIGSRVLRIGSNGYLEWRRVDSFNVFDDLTIDSGGILTHTTNKDAMVYWLNVTLNNLTLQGSINLNGKGYGGSKGPGASGGSNGASYGGYGAYAGAGAYSPPYGSILAPTELGSGASGNGGGRLTLNVLNQLSMEATGQISANGSSGGSGGSILIYAPNIIWTEATPTPTNAFISALGGNGSGGGGGRIAIYYTVFTPTGTLAMDLRAYGGTGSSAGGAGTIFTKQNLIDLFGNLIVNNLDRVYNEKNSTPLMDPLNDFDSISTDSTGTILLPQGMAYELPSALLSFRLIVAGQFLLPSGGQDLVIGSGGFLEWRKPSKLMLNNLTINSGGAVTHTSNADTAQNFLDVDIVQDLLIYGSITADGKGYAYNQGPGLPTDSYTGGAHGGYGGLPIRTSVYRSPSTPYGMDTLRTPMTLGSGSRQNGSTVGAAGGGAIHLRVGGALTLDGGTISAQGTNGTGQSLMFATAGGAGGSIWLDTTDFQFLNSASIKTNGGRGATGITSGAQGIGPSYTDATGCGSGGRISINYETSNLADNVTHIADWPLKITSKSIQNWGGNSITCNTNGSAGSPGTIYILDKNDPANTKGSIYIYNDNLNYVSFIDTPIDDSFSPDRLAAPLYLGSPTSRFVVLSSQSFTLPSNTIDYPISIEGLMITPSGPDLTIASGGVLDWRRSNSLNLNSITINSGGTLTHQPNGNDHTIDLKVNVVNLTVQTGGLVDATGMGHGAGQGPGGIVTGAGAYGANSSVNKSYGSITTPASLGSGGNGGGGGGRVSLTVTNTLTLNGTLRANGKTSTSSTNTAGGSGGTIFIDTNILTGPSGALEANGGDGYLTGEGGSGGRIAILYNDDTGFGPSGSVSSAPISAYGGGSTQGNRRGAAGTIFFKNKATDLKGHLYLRNLAGTYNPDIVTPITSDLGLDSISVDTQSRLLIPLGAQFQLPSNNLNYHLILEGTMIVPTNQLVVQGTGQLEMRSSQKVILSQLDVLSGGKITHTANMDVKRYWIDLETTGHLNLNLGAEINVTGKGYASGYGAGKGINVSPPLTFAGAGSYAGIGNPAQASLGATYGSVTQPEDIGSGGGNVLTTPTTLGGAGGGFVKLTVGGTLTLDGDIYANGADGLSQTLAAIPYYGGAGSGGTIRIQADTITRTAVSASAIQTNGGGAVVGAHGGGGRIHLSFTNDLVPSGGIDPSNTAQLLISNKGGSGPNSRNGGAGTTMIKTLPSLTAGKLFINNENFVYTEKIETEILGNEIFDAISIGTSPLAPQSTGVAVAPTGVFTLLSSNLNYPLRLAGNWVVPSNNLNVKDGGKLIVDRSSLVSLSNLVVESGGLVTHAANTTAHIRSLKLALSNNLEVQTGGLIDVSGRGFSGGFGQGRGSGSGATAGSGGGHGGAGGGGVSGVGASGVSYDVAVNPTFIGSGGGAGACTSGGGAGGGFIEVNATNQIIVNGEIKADGASPSCVTGGGGGGGSIILKSLGAVDGLMGSGLIQAKGGDVTLGASNGGSGGGGIIHVELVSTSFLGTFNVSGGTAEANRLGGNGLLTTLP